MNVTDMGGHSGCKILLCEDDDNNSFVRKISSDVEYNVRLKIQAEKQASFLSKTIKTPRILATGYTDEGLFYFDMEYIQGLTMAEYMQTIEIGRVRGLVESIVRDLVSIDPNDSTVDETVFTKKIADLKNC